MFSINIEIVSVRTVVNLHSIFRQLEASLVNAIKFKFMLGKNEGQQEGGARQSPSMCIPLTHWFLQRGSDLQKEKVRALLKGTNLKGQTPICNLLQVPAVFCGSCESLRLSAKSCASQTFGFLGKGETLQKSVRICKNAQLSSSCGVSIAVTLQNYSQAMLWWIPDSKAKQAVSVWVSLLLLTILPKIDAVACKLFWEFHSQQTRYSPQAVLGQQIMDTVAVWARPDMIHVTVQACNSFGGLGRGRYKQPKLQQFVVLLGSSSLKCLLSVSTVNAKHY